VNIDDVGLERQEMVAGPHSGGLSGTEAARQLAAHGRNTLPDQARHGWRNILGDAAREPMVVLLLGRQRGLGAALRTANPVFAAIVPGALGLLAAALWLPPLAELFRFAPPPGRWLALGALSAAVMVLGLAAARPDAAGRTARRGDRAS
jgi:hypothetical protein